MGSPRRPGARILTQLVMGEEGDPVQRQLGSAAGQPHGVAAGPPPGAAHHVGAGLGSRITPRSSAARFAVADRRAHVSVGRDHPRPRPLLTVSIALSRRRTVRHIDPENFRSLTPINYGHFTQRERSSVRLEGQQICSEAYTKSTAGKEIIMSFMLVFLIPVAALFGGAVVYDLTRRRRHGPRHDVTSAARKARSDAESHGSP